MSDENIKPLMWKEGVECAGVLCVWPGVTVSETDNILDWFKKSMRIEPLIVGTVLTLPDPEHQGMEEPPTGGRTDFFFYVRAEDIPRFSTHRLHLGMRWWEDVFYTEQQDIYPLEFRKAYPCPIEGWDGEEE